MSFNRLAQLYRCLCRCRFTLDTRIRYILDMQCSEKQNRKMSISFSFKSQQMLGTVMWSALLMRYLIVMTHLAINLTLLSILSLLFTKCMSAGLQQVYRKLAVERQTFLSGKPSSDPNKAAAHVRHAASPYAGKLQQLCKTTLTCAPLLIHCPLCKHTFICSLIWIIEETALDRQNTTLL